MTRPRPSRLAPAKGREFRALTVQANVGEIFDATLNHRSVAGATGEIQQHYGIDSNVIPLALLVRSWPDDLEIRASGNTAAPTNVGQNQQSIVPYVFPDSVWPRSSQRGHADRWRRRGSFPGIDYCARRPHAR